MKQKLAFLVAYWWVLGLGVAGLSLLLFAPRDARVSEYENRMLQERPVLSAAAVSDGSYMSEMETYLSDAVFGRDALISVSSGIRDGFSVLPDDGVTDEAEEMVEALLADDEAPEAETVADAPAAATEAPGEAEDADPDTDAAADAGDWRLYMKNADGSEHLVYAYPEENVRSIAAALNVYRDALPADGSVYFMQVPFAATALSWTKSRHYVGWSSTVEDGISLFVDDGVHVMNTPEILAPYMEQEQLYFFTDHHWTPRGANYAVMATQRLRGLPAVPYDEYAYQAGMTALIPKYNNKALRDRLEVLELLEPAESWLVYRLTEQVRQQAVIYGLEQRYMAFLNGSRGPWRRLVTGYHTGRRALIVGDSYGNVFSPYLFPYYDEVHMVDYRRDYYSAFDAGVGTRKYIEAYDIDDVYFVVSTASGINSGFVSDLSLRFFDY